MKAGDLLKADTNIGSLVRKDCHGNPLISKLYLKEGGSFIESSLWPSCDCYLIRY